MPTIRLTMAQALTRWMAVQSIRQFDGSIKPAFAGVWAIFGHGNVAGLGEALHAVKDQMPTFRGHNEQSMAHSAIAYAKQKSRRQMMAVTSSIGPGATNMVTAMHWHMLTACLCCFYLGMFLLTGGLTLYCNRLNPLLTEQFQQMTVLSLYAGILTALPVLNRF